MVKPTFAAVALGWILSVQAGSLADIDHVVLFMQENRAFDHVKVFTADHESQS